MDKDILELYPHAGREHPLRGLYLDQITARDERDDTFIYSNFISSLDGRIALPGAGRDSHEVPAAIANSRDWRLFQELAAQADLLITSARYFRQASVQEAQDELPVGSAGAFDDLRAWRLQQGLAPQPDIAVFSASLDIPHTSIHNYADRKVYVITGSQADETKLERITAASHAEIIHCGSGNHVDATLLRNRLAELGYRNVYAIAGPAVLHTLVQGNALDRLYHTTAHCLLGGTRFDTFVWGEQLDPACCMPLRAMYLDRQAPPGASQTLAIYGR